MTIGLNPKKAFNKLQAVTKYNCFEKRDGSIISRVKIGDQIVQKPELVNSILGDSLQALCGDLDATTLTRSHEFPHLPKMSIHELRDIVCRLSKDKAIASDFCEDSAIWDMILDEDNDAIAKMFTSLWDKNITNSKAFERHLTGRLIPLNKVHPEIPKPDEMRPIIALSPILKLLESRFRDKLEKYMSERMIPCQVGFVRNCGTHVNIVRLIKRCLIRYNDVGKKKGGFKPKAILFIDLKSAYNNVNLNMLFRILLQKNILVSEEVSFLRTLYSKTTLTVGNNKVQINKGVMQGSTISPALFNIFIEPLLKQLNDEFDLEDIFAYADDIAVCVYSIRELDRATEIINDWSAKAGIPINLKKSGILNIRNHGKIARIVNGDSHLNYPVVERYKYLGVWLDEKLNPQTHLELYKSKINYIINRLRMIPKKTTTPRYLINLWTLIIRPVYDYAYCLAKLKNKTNEKKYLAEELRSFKKLMSLRITTSNELIKDLIGYEPNKLCSEIIRRAERRWNERKGITVATADHKSEEKVQYRRETSNLLVTWDMLWCNNLLFSKCKQHKTSITPSHMQSSHGGKLPPNLSNTLKEGFELQQKIKNSNGKRKGRIVRLIEKKINAQDIIARTIIDSISGN